MSMINSRYRDKSFTKWMKMVLESVHIYVQCLKLLGKTEVLWRTKLQ